MKLPSDELINTVLPNYVKPINYQTHLIIDNNTLYEVEDDTSSHNYIINIYELMDLIKIFANNKGYMIQSTRNGTAQYKGFASVSYTEKRLGDILKNFGLVSTEFDAVVNAGEWLLKEIQK